jgi:hypothetical protein
MVASETIHGLRVDRFDDNTFNSKSVLYYAPDLGCQKVKAVYHWNDADGSIRSTTVEEPTEIRLGPPDESLFQTDASYREVLPSERRRALYLYLAGKEPPGAAESYERADKRYLEARRNQRADIAR